LFARHRLACDGKQPQCPYCARLYPAGDIEAHVEQCATTPNPKCDICGVVFAKKAIAAHALVCAVQDAAFSQDEKIAIEMGH